MTQEDDDRAFVQSKISGRIRVLAADEAPSEAPAWWIEANAAAGRDAVAIALEHWRPVVGARLPQFLAQIERDGTGVFLARRARLEGKPDDLLLLYALADPDDPSAVLTRFGPLPAAAGAVPACWPNLPAELQSFFLALHNGFHVDLGGLGLHEADSFVFPSEHGEPDDYEFWSPSEDNPHVSHLVEVAGDGCGGGLCLDVSNREGQGWDWYQGMFKAVDFWPALDTILRQDLS
ncbi:hypothetical protein [Segniliparus rugosus]|uniref:SMI1/KNR4 family protein n=1 Tax=Segniliparus rugosus (strain ATCC BAA-974 / DSM 45345 / CCUG 50838 / CIP 108380 / JCM 13579 / CDC 945) TaxID=679197 RepID=E5XQL3_SEGRC|nr:hypothetical protein [Segniliparus rugosus]EFV13363.1 hypothetical protein HMPREF9336_01785 [Segniliparus rugosus ATCC BAA-974]